MEFEQFMIGWPDYFDGDFDMVRAPVGIGVDDFRLFVYRRPQRHRADISQRLQNHLRRRVDDNLSRCLYGHYVKASNAAAFADEVERQFRHFEMIFPVSDVTGLPWDLCSS
jgi:hypothetical protein